MRERRAHVSIRIMLQPYYYEHAPQEREDFVGAALAIALLVGLFLLLALAPPRDPAKLLAGVPCSILSESQISSVYGTTMRLRPTDGSVCQYVSTDGQKQAMLFVVARHDDGTPSTQPNTQALTLRHHGRAYTLIAIGDPEHAKLAQFREQQLALLVEGRVAKGSTTH
jgi:hypothetical protein